MEDWQRGAWDDADVDVDKDGPVWFVTPRGEHDCTVPKLQNVLDALIGSCSAAITQSALVVVDLSRVAFFDSSVISAIVRASRAVEDDPDLGLAVVVESPDCIAARLLHVAGVMSQVPTFARRADAVAALARSVTP
jgi:anti-anti-sigma factor